MVVFIVQEFNAEQWARDHETLCTSRFEEVRDNLSRMWRIFGVAGMCLLGLLSWSLKSQYDQGQAQLNAIRTVSAQVAAK